MSSLPVRHRTWLWWSSGKDSAWALHQLRKGLGPGGPYDVTALVTTVTSDRVAVHAVPTELVRAQARALGLPLHLVEIPHPCPNAVYEEACAGLIRQAEAEGVTHMAFGDLFLADIRAYRENLLAPFAIEPIFPLWGRETRALAEEMVDGGLRARLTCLDSRAVDARFAGREFDHELLGDLPSSVDPCGENGEFHTFVFDSPDFDPPLAVKPRKAEQRGDFVYADLESP